MKFKYIFIIVLLFRPFSLFAQDNTPSFNKFYKDVVAAYTKLSAPPINNYFTVLANTVKYTFTEEDPLFIHALTEISNTEKIAEEAALDSLFTRVFTKLRGQELWNSNKEMYAKFNLMFQVYNKFLCKCISRDLLVTSSASIVLDRQKECISGIVMDTVFQRALKNVAGEFTLDDLFKNQALLVIFMYENCDIINAKLNDAIYSGAAENYHSAIYARRVSETNNIFTLFKSGKLDSLKVIFPGYKNYSAQLKSVVLKLNKSVKTNSFYQNRILGEDNPKSNLVIIDSTNNGIQVELVFKKSQLKTTVVSMSLKPYSAANVPAEDEIIEIIEAPKKP